MSSVVDDSINKNCTKKRGIKKRILLWTSALLIIASVIAIVVNAYRYYEENKVIINRNFKGLKFGDSPSQASSIFGEKPDLIWVSSESDECGSFYYSVAYGDRTIDTLSLLFYKQKLYGVEMTFNINHDDQENNWTFNKFKTLFERKGYNQTHTDYSNEIKFEDKHTSLKLWHSYDERGERWVSYNSNPQILITYYDKDSGYREIMDSGF